MGAGGVSTTLEKLQTRLADVTELLAAHVALTGGGRGKPAARQGAALTRAGIIMLAAAFEAFVEDIFEEVAPLIFPDLADPGDRKKFFCADFGPTEQRRCPEGRVSLLQPWLAVGDEGNLVEEVQ